jgi:hypothetical protein
MKVYARSKMLSLFAAVPILFAVMAPQAQAGFSLGQGANFAVLVEPDLHNFNLTSDSGVTGNVGIGSPINAVQLSSGTITGNLDFSGAAPSGGPAYGGTVTGTEMTSDSNVTSALSTVNSLSSTLGAESGTALTISGGGQTIDATSGTCDTGVGNCTSGGGNYVFSVSASHFNPGGGSGGITINGTASQYVVINIDNGTTNESINGAISLSGGITADHVLFNFVGTGGELGGAANDKVANGVFLAPDMKVNLNSVTIDGRLFGGGSTSSNNDFAIVSNAYVHAPGGTVPEPTSILLLGAVLAVTGTLLRRRLSSDS